MIYELLWMKFSLVLWPVSFLCALVPLWLFFLPPRHHESQTPKQFSAEILLSLLKSQLHCIGLKTKNCPALLKK